MLLLLTERKDLKEVLQKTNPETWVSKRTFNNKDKILKDDLKSRMKIIFQCGQTYVEILLQYNGNDDAIDCHGFTEDNAGEMGRFSGYPL